MGQEAARSNKKAEEGAASRPSKKVRKAAASSLTAFMLRLAKRLADTDEGTGVGGGGQNVVFSPTSIYAALALMSAGARGTTLDEVLSVLGAASPDEIAKFVRGVVERALAVCSESGAPLVAFACALWHEKTLALKTAYSAAAVESYKAETHAADFKSKVQFSSLIYPCSCSS